MLRDHQVSFIFLVKEDFFHYAKKHYKKEIRSLLTLQGFRTSNQALAALSREHIVHQTERWQCRNCHWNKATEPAEAPLRVFCAEQFPCGAAGVDRDLADRHRGGRGLVWCASSFSFSKGCPLIPRADTLPGPLWV